MGQFSEAWRMMARRLRQAELVQQHGQVMRDLAHSSIACEAIRNLVQTLTHRGSVQDRLQAQPRLVFDHEQILPQTVAGWRRCAAARFPGPRI
jgi:hypothetical protein